MRIPINPTREELSSILKSSKIVFDIPGINLVEERDLKKDHISGLNCFIYCFQNEKIGWVTMGELPYFFTIPTGGYHQVRKPQKEDLAVYLSKSGQQKDFTHVGRFLSDDTVLSKWGYNHVYSHLPGLVPAEYGEELIFFRRNKS